VPFVRVGDLDVAYDALGPEDAPAVLMINGLGADRTAWRLQTPALGARYRTIVYDNRDVGQTGPGNRPGTYGIGRFAADAAGLLDALGIGRAHVVGASMGGAIAQEFALAHPDRAASLTVVCSWPRTDPWLAELLAQWERLFAAMGGLEWARTSWLWVFTHRYYADPANLPVLMDGVEAYPYPQSAASYGRQSRAAIGHDARDRLPGIRLPTHVIAGAEDLLTPLRFSAEIAAAIPGARLSVIEAVGHGMFWEATERFNDLVLGFLDEVSLGVAEPQEGERRCG